MKFIKSCEKLSKEELKSINGGTAPYCPVGKVCYRGEDNNGNLLWDCIPASSLCPGI